MQNSAFVWVWSALLSVIYKFEIMLKIYLQKNINITMV